VVRKLRNRGALAPLAVLLIQAVVALPTLFKSIPITSGWYLALAAQAENRTPYRDFFVHMPPGAIFFEGYIPNLFASPFIAQDIAHFVYWLVFSLFLYLIISHLSSPLIGVLISSLVSTAYYAQPGNIISGYFETSLMFQIVGLYFILRWLEGPRWIPLASGIFLGLSLTVRGSAVLFVFCLLIASVVFTVFLPKSRFKLPLQLTALGILIPWGLVGTWSLVRNNTFEMLAQITDTSGKAGWIAASQIFAGNILTLPLNIWLIALLVLVGSVSVDSADGSRPLKRLEVILACAAMLSLSFGFLPGGTEPHRLEPLLLLFGAGSFAIFAYCDRLRLTQRILNSSLLLVTGALVLTIVFAWRIELRDIPEATFPEISWKDALAFNDTFSLNARGYGLFGALATLIRPDLVSHKVNAKLVRLVALSVICQRYVDSVAGGSTLETWTIGFAMGLIFMMNLIRKHSFAAVATVTMFTTVTAVFGLIVSQNAKPYEWLGVRVVPISSNLRIPYGNEAVRFSVEKNDAAFFDEVFAAIEAYNIKGSQTFFSMRNAGMAQWFNIPMYPSACVVLWFDVCPERFAKMTYDQIMSDPPKFALISFESIDDMVNPNEQTWGDGTDSYQRLIQNFFNPQLNPERYEILAIHKPSATSDAVSPVTMLLHLQK